MKRILALILSIITVFSLFACAAEETKTETAEKNENGEKTEKIEQTETLEKEVVQNNHVVNDKTTKEKLAAIPIANDSMTEDELRQICVDFMKLQNEFPWIPEQTLDYKKLAITRYPGTLYGGIPYISTASGNIYRAMEYYNEETGTIDLTNFVNNPEFFGNACSGGAFWSWFRVVNSFDSSSGAWTQNCTHLNGALRVGPYTYKDVQNFHEVKYKGENKYTAENAVKENSQQTMFESYALVKPADGLVHPGHVRMVYTAPVVERNPDGTIDGDKSYLTCLEQVKYVNHENHDRTQEDGTFYKAQGSVGTKYTFNELIEKYYIPFTFAEFLGTDPVEKGEVKFDNVSGNTTTLAALNSATLTSNYPISDVFIVLTDENGKEIYNFPRRKSFHYSYVSVMKDEGFNSTMVNMMKPYAEKGNCTLTISVQISTGEKLIAFSGLLVA